MAGLQGSPPLQGNTPSAIDPAQGRAVRDDRIFPETRWVGLLIVLFLGVAFVLLFLFPGNTKELFAWEIKPEMTPLMMGAGYISGSYFFLRLFAGGRWHWYSNGFLAITAFTWFMALATILHIDKFTHNHIAFYAWFGLYIATPFLVPFLWFRNQATDPGTPDPDDVLLSPGVRLGIRIAGAVMVAIALFMFIVPDIAIGVWPWKLTPLTARIVGGWFALPGVLALALSFDKRWSAWRILLESQMFGIALILLGAARAWGDFDQSRIGTWLFIGGLSLLLISLLALYMIMESRRRKLISTSESHAHTSLTT